MSPKRFGKAGLLIIVVDTVVPDKITFKSENFNHFIALIHPIQWTIAYPVGADRPAKRQKKTSCVSTG